MRNLRLAVYLFALAFCFCMTAGAQTSNANYPEALLNVDYGADTGSVNALVSTLVPCPSAYVTGMIIRVKPANANTTTTPTLNFCALGAKTITKNGTAAVAANDLTTTAIAVLIYDGTGLQLQNPQTSGTGNVTGSGLTAGHPTAGNGSSAIQVVGNDTYDTTNGNYTQYDGMTTAGVGLATVLGVSDKTAQTASLSSQTLLSSAPSAGFYTVKLYIDQNATCSTGTGTVYATLTWTDATASHTAQTVPLTLATSVSTAVGYVNIINPVYLANASTVTYTTTFTACTTGSGSYDLHAEIERTN